MYSGKGGGGGGARGGNGRGLLIIAKSGIVGAGEVDVTGGPGGNGGNGGSGSSNFGGDWCANSPGPGGGGGGGAGGSGGKIVVKYRGSYGSVNFLSSGGKGGGGGSGGQTRDGNSAICFTSQPGDPGAAGPDGSHVLVGWNLGQ